MRWPIMRIVQISDSHIALGGPADDERMAALAACVDHINQMEEAPDLVVHTGDVVHNGTETEYAMARDHLSRLKAPLKIIPGNKDRRAELVAAFPDMCSQMPGQAFVQYVVDLDELRLVFLDTVSETSNKGSLCETRFAHLDEALSQAPKPVLLFMHHPTFEVTTAPEPYQFEERADAARLAEVLQGHPPLVGILAGHMHRHFETEWSGVPALTMTAGAIDLRKGSELGALQSLPYYCVHDITGAGGLVTSLVAAAPQG
ncbi:MAG: metallophosphoesterase [Pseudomonadota bacterium]